jgi:hypothetical protein
LSRHWSSIWVDICQDMCSETPILSSSRWNLWRRHFRDTVANAHSRWYR